jgi:hypothetical protein
MPGRQAKMLSDQQVQDLLCFAETTRHSDRNWLMILLSVKAGLRAGEIPYAALMAAAGYPVVESAAIPSEAVRRAARLGPISPEEEDALAGYLEFIRKRTSGPGR